MPASGQRLMGEHIDILHRRMPGVLIGHLLSGCGLVWVVWDGSAERNHLLGWLAMLACVVVLRWIEYARYRADPARLERAVAWSRRFIVGAALAGMIWGYVGWAFFHPTLHYLFPIALVLGAQVSLSVPTVGVYFPAHAVFNLLATTPFLIRNLAEGGHLFMGQGFALAALMSACLIFSWRQQATIRESIRLRFDNLDLLEQIRQENVITDQARREAEDANAAKSRFLAAASHDLRQPIQALELFVDALKEDVRAGRDASPVLVDKVASASNSLGTLLDSLLDLSRAEVGTLHLDVRDVPLQPLFDRIHDEFAHQAAARGLRLRVVPTSWVVRSDPALLERILRNLISNALRYTERGGILVACRRHGDGRRIEVRDSGIGIDTAQQQAVFDEFYQVGNPERDRRKGLGLGLAIVEALARQLQHRVTVRSAPGRGSTFAVELPAAVSAATGDALPLPAGDLLRGRHVAIIDDDPEVRDAMATMLGRWGCLTTVGERADDIIVALSADAVPAAIVADWRLRDGRSGPEEARNLFRHFGHPIPTVIITGDTTAGGLAEAGFPVLRKPVQGLRLRAQLDALLSE